jgi:ubiquitin-like protein Pup
MAQERVSKERPVSRGTESAPQQAETRAEVSSGPVVSPEDTEAVLSDIDELLDELDAEWTEEAAHDMVSQYVQRGGE